jgi:hypothetical protein
VNSSARFLVAAALLAVTAIFLHARGRNEVLPMRQPLKTFPQQLGEWSGTDVAISQDVLDVIGHMIGRWPASIWQNFTWSPIPSV